MAKNNIKKKTLIDTKRFSKNVRMKGVKSMKLETYIKKTKDIGKITPEEILNGSNRIIEFECNCGSEFFVDFIEFIDSKIQYEKK